MARKLAARMSQCSILLRDRSPHFPDHEMHLTENCGEVTTNSDSDPPPHTPSRALLSSSPNLRDLDLAPSAIKKADITIVHPQLRDLILPLQRGRVLYPRGQSIEEISWEDTERDENESSLVEDAEDELKGKAARRTLVRLNFTPNCLIANKSILAAGGQHGELYISNFPAPLSRSSVDDTIHARLDKRFPTTSLKPFVISQSLQNKSINNSIILLPPFPTDWAKSAEKRRVGYTSKGNDHDSDDDDGYYRGANEHAIAEEDEVRDEDGMIDEDEDMDIDPSIAGTDIDSELEEPLSPATYPNTVPFLHAPRIPHLSIPIRTSISISSTSRRSTSFSSDRTWERDVSRPTRLERQSFSIPRDDRFGQPPIEYVTSRPASVSRIPITTAARDRRLSAKDRARANIATTSKRSFDPLYDEPRLLISNNDLTVKMFSMPRLPIQSQTVSTEPHPHATFIGMSAPLTRHQPRQISSVSPSQSPSQPSSSGGRTTSQPIQERTAVYDQMVRELSVFRDVQWASSELGPINQENVSTLMSRFRRYRSANPGQFDDTLSRGVDGGVGGVSVGTPSGSTVSTSLASGEKEQRRLVRIGGSKFSCAINHCGERLAHLIASLSPDLKNMVSVGDSTDVHLFDVIDGGREFRRIATYKAATDSGFSTCWSRDGRKFAVASQDGQVTVWDHRSSKPLAKFFTSLGGHAESPPSPTFSTSESASGRGAGAMSPTVLVDPVTGHAGVGSSTSGREAARVVKFSPEGASRDLMVFSEENSNIHVVDAQTLNTHIVLPVPHTLSAAATLSQETHSPRRPMRQGIEGGTWGIAGVAFDPSGEWLYAGTERTVVEWNVGGQKRGMGSWAMA